MYVALDNFSKKYYSNNLNQIYHNTIHILTFINIEGRPIALSIAAAMAKRLQDEDFYVFHFT